MKIIILLIALLMTCGTASSMMPYSIYGIVWDEEGNTEGGVPITLAFEDQAFEVITAIDGSFVFSTMNFEKIKDGDTVVISCKYGVKTVEINYYHSFVSGISIENTRQAGIGVTFNEPSPSEAIAAFLAIGFIAIPIGKGIYKLLKRK